MNFKREKIEKWNEAIPLGNGNMGGLLFGDSSLIKLSVDCSSLWDLRQSENLESDRFKFSELLRLVSMGEESNKELQSFFGEFYSTHPYPTKIPSGSFEFVLADGESTEFYFSMREAVGGVKLSGGRVIESFFSATTFLGYVRCPNNVSFRFVAPKYQSNGAEIAKDELASLGYAEGSVTEQNNTIVYLQPTAGGDYSVIAKYKQNGEYTDIVFAVRSQLDGRSESEIICEIDSALLRGYDKDLAEHKRWWRGYFSKVSVTLPGEYKHIEQLYYLAHYMLGSGSRRGYFPMPLQGVWTAADGKLPPWKGDYHFDLNVQGTYNFAYRANRLDEAYPVIDYFIKNRENIEKFSERFFGVENTFFIPGTADLKGNIMGGWVQYTYSIPSSLWMMTILDKWCEYTSDEAYRVNHLLPMMRGAFNLLDKVLIVENGGKYELCISASPEINDCKYSAWVKNSTYDISIIREFLKRYIKRMDEAGESTDRAKQILSGLVCEHIGDMGYLLAENMPLAVTHRHMSHCMNIFPFQTLDYRNGDDMALMQRTLEHLESLGTKLWIGFAFVWMAAMYATCANGEAALKYLDIFADCFVSENGFHLNGDQKKKGYSNYTYQPFTIEGNCMFAEAVQEMLVQYHHGAIHLFPAIPDAFKREGCAFSGLRIDRDITVSASYKNGKIECNVSNAGKARKIEIYHNRSYMIDLACGENSIIINV